MDVSFCQQCGGYIAPEKVLILPEPGGGAAYCPACRGPERPAIRRNTDFKDFPGKVLTFRAESRK